MLAEELLVVELAEHEVVVILLDLGQHSLSLNETLLTKEKL